MTSKDKDDRANEKLVTAEPGSEQYSKSGDTFAVDTDRVKGPGDFYPRSADAENLAQGPVSPTDPNYLEALRKTEGGQEQVDELVAGTDGDSTYGPTGDVTAAHKDGDAKADGDHYDHTGKNDKPAKDAREGDAKDSKGASHTDRNVDVKVQPAHGARDAK
jgi:hypothetical protein